MNPKEQSNHYLMKIILLCFVDIPNHTGSFKFIVRVINVSLSGNYLVDAKSFNTVDIEGTIYNKTYTHMHGWDANAIEIFYRAELLDFFNKVRIVGEGGVEKPFYTR